MIRHRLVVLDPGHFHAALTLRARNPALDDEVFVFAEDGPDLDAFIRLVQSFNDRAVEPTRWMLRIHRGGDCLEWVARMRPGDVVVVAGRNDAKMERIHFLHARGFCVLGDKPWLISNAQTGLLAQALAGPPICMDIMTERHDILNRLQRAFARTEAVFGTFRTDGAEPAISLRSVHHLFKVVNGQPLRRPAWYFDTRVQGEGVTDVTTHLVDLVQWMLPDGAPFDFDRDVRDLAARQWPTPVPRDAFARITGLPDFPDALSARVAGDSLLYLCNAALSYRLRGVALKLEAVWGLKEPEGSADQHHAILRGTKAELVIDQGPATGFARTLSIIPVGADKMFDRGLRDAVEGMQAAYPGLACRREGQGYRIDVPASLRTTHEQHFAAVLQAFLEAVDAGGYPARMASDMAFKYALLARALELSVRAWHD